MRSVRRNTTASATGAGMARLSDLRFNERSHESPDDGACDFCDGVDAVTLLSTRGIEERRRRKVSICAPCCAFVLECRTGFGFVGQLSNWRRLSSLLKQSHKRRRAARAAASEG